MDLPRYQHNSLSRLVVLIECNLDISGDVVNLAVVAAGADAPNAGDPAWNAVDVDQVSTTGVDERGELVYYFTARLLAGPGLGLDLSTQPRTLMDVFVQILDSPEQPIIPAGRIYVA